MKNIFLIIFLMISSGYTFAQVPERLWSKHISPVNIGNSPSCITTDNSGNIYIGGLLYGINLYDYQTVKLNSSGDTLWSATYNGSANFYDIITDIEVDNLGNVYVTGMSEDAITKADVVTIKYNSIGQQVWLKRFSINNNSGESGEILKIDNEGNIYVLGFVYEPGGINTSKVLLLKYTPSGNLIWSKTYAGANQFDRTQHFEFDNSGNIYAVGSRHEENSQIDMLLIKFDSEGNFLWEATHNSIYNNVAYGHKVCITDDNSIYIGGTIYNNDFLSDMCLIKFNSNGNKIWVRTYNGNLNSDDALMTLNCDQNGNVYIAGNTVTFLKQEEYKYYDNIVIKYDSDGNIIWNKLFGIPGNTTDFFGNFTIDVLGNSYLLSNTYTDDLTFSSAVIVKYDPLGNIVYRDWDTSEYTDGKYLHLDNENNLYLLGTNNYRTYLVKYKQSSLYQLTNPIASEKWIAGEKDTIKWTGGEAGTFVTLEISKDSGLTYDMIDFAIPADSGKFIWDIPEDIISTRCIIQILNTATNDTLAKSPAFKIKGYILTKFDGMGRYDIFDPNSNGWAYNNQPNPMWPSSWYSGRFNYSIDNDPYTNAPYPSFFSSSYGAINFPDWPLWVEVFGINRNYWSTFFKIYDKSAQEKWGSTVSNNFQGSCFGFAASSFLYFSYKPQLLAKHPGMPNVNNINSIPIDDSVRKIINGYYLYQFGEQSIENDLASQDKTPKQTLKEIKDMFINDEVDIRTITIYNDPDEAFPGNNNGAHTMAPIGVVKDTSAGKFRVILYDSNNPNDYPYILVDTVANRWSFPNLGATWQGTKKFYLEIPVSNYINRPILSDRPIDNNNIKRGIQNIKIFNTSNADIVLKNSSNEEIGFVNGQVIENIENGLPIIAKTGGNSNPIGYYIPDDDYSIEISKVKDSSNTSRVALFKENKSFVFSRKDADSTQTDRIYVEGSETDGMSGSGFSVSSPDNIQKNITLKLINDLNDKERYFEISGVEMIQNDSLSINELDSNLIFKNFGSEKTYSLNLTESNSSESKIFENAFVMLPANSTHIIQPIWDNLDSSNVIILIDSGNNGSIDDTISILNEFELPVELISFTSSVDKRDVILNWTTSMELNNAGFEIERKNISDINSNWSKISYVTGNGNSAIPLNYTYSDRALSSGAYNYRLKQIDYNGNFEYYELQSEVNVGVPDKFDLSQNYPNPFNPVTKINYDLPFDSRVMMKVYDITGREVYTLINEQKPAGYYTVQFDAGLIGGLASGVYFYRLIATGINGQEFILTKKMMLVK